MGIISMGSRRSEEQPYKYVRFVTEELIILDRFLGKERRDVSNFSVGGGCLWGLCM